MKGCQCRSNFSPIFVDDTRGCQQILSNMNGEKLPLRSEKFEDALNSRNPRVVHKVVIEPRSAPFGIENNGFSLLFSYLAF